MKIAILVPTYNEKENINLLLPKLLNCVADCKDVDFTVCVIDDNSPDGTGDEVLRIKDNLEGPSFHVRLLKRKGKDGLGKAYISGFEEVLSWSENVDYVLQMDADMSHDPSYLLHFVNHAKAGSDFIVGSRYIKGGSVPDWTWYRKALSKFGNIYARALLGSKISDYTGGYNMYSADLLRRLDFKMLDVTGYGFLITLKYNATRNARFISQIPIVFMDRTIGESKMPIDTVIKNFILVTSLRFGHK